MFENWPLCYLFYAPDPGISDFHGVQYPSGRFSKFDDYPRVANFFDD